MSNNNLYDILKNFASLTPKAEAPKPAAEKIYESVEPQGSILSGVDKVEARLAKQFAEGAKVDRFVGHVKKSEKSAGKSNKDAENIAWATANKRGMLDNKNKKESVEEGVAENTSSVSDKELADLIHGIAVHLIFNKQKMSINEADPKLVATAVQKAYKMEGITFGQSDLARVQNIFSKVMRRLRKGFAPEVKDSEESVTG